MFLCLDPASVSTYGRPRFGPSSFSNSATAKISFLTGSGSFSNSSANSSCRPIDQAICPSSSMGMDAVAFPCPAREICNQMHMHANANFRNLIMPQLPVHGHRLCRSGSWMIPPASELSGEGPHASCSNGLRCRPCVRTRATPARSESENQPLCPRTHGWNPVSRDATRTGFFSPQRPRAGTANQERPFPDPDS